jgi:LysM repeat protein
VQAGQTLYFLSRKYQVPIDVIIAHNPGSETGLSINQKILIPKDEVNTLINVAQKADTAGSYFLYQGR